MTQWQFAGNAGQLPPNETVRVRGKTPGGQTDEEWSWFSFYTCFISACLVSLKDRKYNSGKKKKKIIIINICDGRMFEYTWHYSSSSAARGYLSPGDSPHTALRRSPVLARRLKERFMGLKQIIRCPSNIKGGFFSCCRSFSRLYKRPLSNGLLLWKARL